jgi:phosphohistidine phosphatase
MQIYILRHGIAEESHSGGNDAERELTPDGKRKLRDTLRLARRAGVEADLIVTSPYVRAVETARIAAEVLEYGSQILSTDALIPSSDPEAVWEEIRVHKSLESILLVGHEPLLSHLTGFLLAAPALFIDMKKGALVRVDVQEFGVHARGILKWMLVPKLAVNS